MQAETLASLATLARWSHVPLAMVVISIVGFVRLFFDAGRLWLAYAVVGIRLVALALNFLTGVNVNFREITALDHLQLWGGAVVAGPIGVPNPWAIVPQLSNLLLVAFIVDASVTLWRRGGLIARRRAALVGGSLAFASLRLGALGASSSPDASTRPPSSCPASFIVVLAMGYELVWDLIAAAQLAAQLRESEQRFRAVVETVPSAILLVNSEGDITLANAQAEIVIRLCAQELVGRAGGNADSGAASRDPRRPSRTVILLDARPRAMGAAANCLGDRRTEPKCRSRSASIQCRSADGICRAGIVVDITERWHIER